MDILKLIIVAAGTALMLSPAAPAAQTEQKPISMGIKLAGMPQRAEIAAVRPGRTGALLGLKIGDILVEAGGRAVSPQVLEEYMEGKNPGDELTFKIRRGDSVIELKARAVAEPEAAVAAGKSHQ